MKLTKQKILFFAESLTLAHITRPWALASSLSDQDYDIYFAVSSLPVFLKNNMKTMQLIDLKTSIDSNLFTSCLEKATLPFTEETIYQQVQEDLLIIKNIQPDVIVGDFRLSLSISTEIAKIPYVNINNICWSPHAKQKSIVPDVELRHKWGLQLSHLFFKFGKTNIFKKLAKPFNTVVKKFGIDIKFDSILDVYCDGDRVFFADIEELVPTTQLPSHHIIGGPINFSFPNTNTVQYTDFPVDRPIVCISLGSSGPSKLLEGIVESLSSLPINIIVSTAGKAFKELNLKNVKVEKYVSITEIARIADLVICSGGSATAYPCLTEGVPLLAIPSNLDQFQFAQALVNKGVAKLIRPESVLIKNNLILAVKEILFQPEFKARAIEFKNEILKYNFSNKFQQLIENLLIQKEAKQQFVSDVQMPMSNQLNIFNQLTKTAAVSKKILVTGANGFLGSHFLRFYPNAIVFDRNRYDISDIQSFKDLIADIDVIVHLAGVNSGTSYNPTVAELSDGNMFVTSQLLRAIRAFNKKSPQFIFMSSIHVYDKSSAILTEDLRPMPSTPYGSMKYAQELLITQAAESGIIRSMIFRAGHIYGPKSKPFYNSAVATICYKVFNSESVDLYGNGHVEFDLTYVDDVIKYISLGIEKNNQAPVTILNLGSGQTHTISHIIDVLETVIKKSISRNLVTSPIQKNSISIEKLVQHLGSIKYTPLQDGLTLQMASLMVDKPQRETTLSTN